MGQYKVGTIVMRNDGITHVKTKENGWVAEHRHIMQNRLDRELVLGEKVFHRDNTLKGTEDFNKWNNLIVIKCRTTKWIKLTHSRVIYEPKKEQYPAFAK